ncbi:M14 family zinc carboxypeptidase [Lutibacter flavus]|uniref:Por secretion system C-terminal sorting domain-containing protein n=1 Tax=Lutibacter flavus TaxID=691689 RepID=A0A238WZ24_9FLAO|nr:M14 family zinc carboxypeptidase [Lutibacter flavus]SNR51668.1 Por secretion system C-terminal sorting domain-containing protein [Lutibacter flavus]
MRNKLLLVLYLIGVLSLNAQSNKELANKYLNERGELAFTFTANNIDEIQQLANIISFDHGQNHENPFTINAISNRKEFDKFLEFNLPFTVDIKLNEPKDVVMFDPKIHKKGVSGKNAAYALSFPLTAYPTYAQYEQQMQDFATDHPAIAQLVDIGGTTEGVSGGDKRLLFIKLSDNAPTREVEPRVMYTSSMHGDEIAGYPMMLSLIDYLITAYENTSHTDHARIKNLLENSEVWINPLANPDATYWLSDDNSSVSNSRRYNAKGVDLNRNYPDNVAGPHYDGYDYQVETTAFMKLADNNHFVISANFHGGTEVVNFPWDNTSTRHPDDDWYKLISKEYAVNCQADGAAGYMDAVYTNSPWPGVTNGSDWYTVFGGRQDYMNFEKHAKEVTIELSNTKIIPTTQIQNHWNYNRDALVDYFLQGSYGFHGIVKDINTGTPIKAKITLVGHDALGSWVETELPLGDFYRPINAGSYNILFEADCYQSLTLPSQVIADGARVDLGDILLTPSSGYVSTDPTNISKSNIALTSATVSWDDTGANTYDFRYRVGASSWIEQTVSNNTIDLSNLSPDTTYDIEVRSTCGSQNSIYSSSTLTTLDFLTCVTPIVSYPYSESFENTLGAWTQSTSDDINWLTRSGTTPTSSTGPSGASNGTYYLFTESSSPTPTYALAELNSPCFDLSGYIDAKFSFDYYWYGSEIDQASLIVEVRADDDVEYTTLFKKTGTSVNSWVSLSATPIDLSAYSGKVIKLKISGITGDGIRSDMAFDNFSLTATVNASLGIEDEILSAFQLYPNPSNIGEVRLKVPNEIQAFNIVISNTLGQKLYSNIIENYNSKTHTINTQGFKTGIYMVTVSTNLGKSTKKLVIQ